MIAQQMLIPVIGHGIAALLPLVIVILLLALFVFLLVNSKRKGRIIFGILAVSAFAFVAFGVVTLLVVRSSHSSLTSARAIAQQRALANQADQQRLSIESSTVQQYEMAKEPYFRQNSRSADSQPSNEPIEPSRVEKSDLAAAGFEPDIFASKEAAVRAVTRMAAKQYKAMIASPDDLPHGARVSYAPNLGGQGEDRASQTETLTLSANRVLTKVLGNDPQFDVVVLPEPTDDISLADSPRRISIFLKVIQEPGAGHGSDNEGIVKATIVGKAGRLSRQVIYLNKPWSDDFDQWRNRREPASSWVLGESEDFCPDRAQSIDQAMRSAASRLREPVSRELMCSLVENADWLSHQENLYRWLDKEGYRRLKAKELPTDVFTQEFKRPYGSVWRSAVLVHVPPEQAGAILANYRAQYGAQRVTMLQTLASAGGLLVLILAVYGFLSAATRGYYAWSVRLATVVLAAVGVWCIWLFVA